MKIPFYRHSLKLEDVTKVAPVLSSPFLTSGPVCKEVEEQLCSYFGANHSKLVNSWTNGAVATLLALDIGPGDEVIVPAMTFIATANVVELVGATPIFIDCDPETILITPQLVKKALTSKTKAIIPVHMYGQMCDVRAIKEILPENQTIYIIEDCAHSFEAKYNGDRPGKYSDVAIFSFYATKNITCGEGGAIICNNSTLYHRILEAVHHGMSAPAADRFKIGNYQHWVMDNLGTKANLSDLLACYLPEQIKNIDDRLVYRENICQKYEQALVNTKIKLIKNKLGNIHARHLFPIHVGEKYRDQALQILGEENIGATVNYNPVTSMSFYTNKYGFTKEEFPVSYYWGKGTLSIPLYPGLKDDEQNYILDVLVNKIDKLIGENNL